MEKHKILIKLSTVALALLTSIGLTACGSNGTQQTANHSTQTTSDSSHTVASSNVNALARLNYQPKKTAIMTVNHNRATIKPNWSSDHIDYSKLDARQRTSYHNEGWLDKNNLAHDNLRTKQTFKPTGYHQKFVNGQPIVNRGHEIAYSLSKGIDQQGQYNPKRESGDQNNPRNLFTQTSFSNQKLQAIYEAKTRQALRNGEKVVYQVQPIFQNKDDMAKGVHMQAISTNHKLDYNVYIFNVQPGVKFDYATGKAKLDSKMKIPTPKNAPHYNDNNQRNNRRYNRKSSHHYFPRYYHHHYIRNYMMYLAIRREVHRINERRMYHRHNIHIINNRRMHHFNRMRNMERIRSHHRHRF